MASRHKSREIALQGLYQRELIDTDLQEILKFDWYDKNMEPDEKEFAADLICGVIENWELIDNKIKENSINRKIDQISTVNRCILRVGIYSLLFEKETPFQVVIDESLKLTREFMNEESVQFINGILDTIHKKSNL